MKEQPATPTPRILIVDDNLDIHQDFRKIFGEPTDHRTGLRGLEEELFDEPDAAVERVAFRLDSAHQGEEGLALVEQAIKANDPYTLAFVDIRMPPGWDGVETLQRIWQVCPELQAVICTAYSDYTWNDLFRQLGHRDNLLILKKPCQPVEVLQMAHALARKSELARQARLRMEDLDRMVQQRTLKLQQEVEERTRAQDALRISEERFSKAFEFNPMPMAIESWPGGRFQAANASFLKLAEYEAEQLLQHTGRELGLGTENPADAPAEARVSQQSCRLLRRDGTERDTVLWAEPMKLGEQASRLVVVEDVTEHLKLESQLRQSQKLELVGRLVANVAHEFNNVLTVIQGHATLLQGRLAGTDVPRDGLDRILQASRRAASFTSQLLGFSRRQMVAFRAVDLPFVVEDMRKMLEQSLGERHRLELQLADSLSPVRASAGGVEQILINLTLNARDAMPEGGVIALSAGPASLSDADATRHPGSRPGEFVRLSVTDRGCGMTPEMISRIFDPFFTTKEVGKGTGLGLSTVQTIVQQHDGWVEVASKPGIGSTFNVYFPIWQGALPAQPKPPAAEPAPKRGAGEAVLLVEDEPTVRETARVTLEEGGYRVSEAADGHEALKVWDASPGGFALLVTDMVMPNGMSGGDLARSLQSRAPGLRVICTSGYTPEYLEHQFKQNAEIIFLPKPYLPGKLLTTINQCLGATPSPEPAPPVTGCLAAA